MKRNFTSGVNLLTRANQTVLLLLAAILAICAPASWAQDVVTRAPGESIQEFCQKHLPEGVELAHPPLQIAFGPSEKNIVVLFRKAYDIDTNYSGWIFVPENGEVNSYKKNILPPMIEIPGHFDITIEAAFAANNGTRSSRDLVVLYQYHRNGWKVVRDLTQYQRKTRWIANICRSEKQVAYA
jgi:hypothetical protein